jgi:hypothetical protein
MTDNETSPSAGAKPRWIGDVEVGTECRITRFSNGSYCELHGSWLSVGWSHPFTPEAL